MTFLISVMLGWFVDPDVAEMVIRDDEHEVDARPERIPMKCLDENMSVHAIRKYFTFDAWLYHHMQCFLSLLCKCLDFC